jgi:cytochrome c-type biogenesis protein CcmF
LIGYICLLIALISAAGAALLYIVGIKRKQPRFLFGGRMGIGITLVEVTIASVWLLYLLVSRDFQTAYVSSHTSRDLTLPYTISAFWAGMEGSLLLWAWMLSIFATIVIFPHRENEKFKPYVGLILVIILAFLLSVLVFASNPFTKLSYKPSDGYGLNPLLQDPGMMFHPPTLFVGYAGFAVPFAFAMAGLWTKKDDWIYNIRRWTLFSWLFLGFGIFLGGWWSYHVLGWGGYWAWDPIENASLIPWLLASAFLHSVMIQEGKGGMKVWNMLLIIFTFLSVFFATFLTRSGIISSVHAFAQSPVGSIFLIFILLTFFACIGLVVFRLKTLATRNIFEAYLSRETSFLFNNLIFVVLTFIVFSGTVFPLLSEVIRGYQLSVGPGFYNESFLPLALILVLLMGVCILIAWRKASLVSLKKNSVYPIAASVVAASVFFLLGVRDFPGMAVVFVSTFISLAIGLEFYRVTNVEGNAKGLTFLKGLGSSIKRNRRKFGGQIIHISIVLMLIGVAGSTLYENAKMFSIGVGETYAVDSHTFTFEGFSQRTESNRVVTVAMLDINIDGKEIQRVSPTISYYVREETFIRSPHISGTMLQDVYVVLQDYVLPQGTQGGEATFTVKTIPLINLIWISMIVMGIGTIIAMSSGRKR